MDRILSGMRPTGELHLGNYFGAIRQFIDLQSQGHDCYFFIADLHALTELTGKVDIDQRTIEVAKNYLACGIDPQKSTLYRQSDVPEVSEIAVLLGNIVKLGKLQTCTTFKERVANRGMEPGEVSYGLLGYPVLMAADILSVRAKRVPVGRDQLQHIEMARDFAQAFNRMFQCEVFVVPQANELSPVRVPGINGAEKMGKSDGNTISLLDSPKAIKKKISKIPTQTEFGGELAQGTQALFVLMDLLCGIEVTEPYRMAIQANESVSFGEMKQKLTQSTIAFVEPIQAKHAELSNDDVRELLMNGAKAAREQAKHVLDTMHQAIGLRK